MNKLDGMTTLPETMNGADDADKEALNITEKASVNDIGVDPENQQLGQIQKAFSELISAKLSAKFSAKEVEPRAGLFSTQADLLERRLAIYRGNMQGIWNTALRNAYPVLFQLAGEEFFTYLALQYGSRYPSQSGDLNLFGAQFSKFLSIEATVADYPYFGAVAALEWQSHCAYYAENIASISLSQFLSDAGVQAQQCRLLFHPAVNLFQTPYAAVQVYLAHQMQPIQAIDVPLNTSSRALISRPRWQVIVTTLDATSFLALEALQQGHTLGDALELAVASDSQFDIGSALQNWFALGVFVGFECKE